MLGAMNDPSTTPTAPPPNYGQHLRTMRTVRWVMVLVGLAVGVGLFLNGNVVAGALIGGFAALRIAMMLYVSHRRHQFRAAMQSGQPRAGMAGRAGPRGRRRGGWGTPPNPT
jgi:hypothetical protein